MLDFLMNHMMLMHEENCCHLQLIDLFSLNLKNKNFIFCMMHVCILNNEKKNQTEWIEYKAIVRHKNSLLCIILQFAFYLFYHWNIVQEQILHFQRWQQWYDFHLLQESKLTLFMLYKVQLKWINKMFDVISIFSFKKTHDCDAEAQADELSDTLKFQIHYVKWWNTDALFMSYLIHLLLKFIQVMTDFKLIFKFFFDFESKLNFHCLSYEHSNHELIIDWCDSVISQAMLHTRMINLCLMNCCLILLRKINSTWLFKMFCVCWRSFV